jgi:CBS domain-containing membrane protein
VRANPRIDTAFALGAPLALLRDMHPQVAPSFDPRVDVLMTPRPIPIAPGQPVEAAAALMSTCHVRHLPVVVDAALTGILSLRDVIAAPDGARVSEIMAAPAQTIDPWQPLTVACERMLTGRFSCLPVLDGGALTGIFTATDALRFAASLLEEDGRTLRRAPPAGQLMTPRPLVVVEPETTLASAWRMMRDAGVRHLPVMRDDAIVGVLSDRDVLAAGRDWMREAAEHDEHVLLVADAMSVRLSTISADAPASDAAQILLRRRVGALPVLRGRELRGMLTVSDFLYFILARA